MFTVDPDTVGKFSAGNSGQKPGRVLDDGVSLHRAASTTSSDTRSTYPSGAPSA